MKDYKVNEHYKTNEHYTNHRGFDPIIVLITIILILLVLEASWGQIYDYFGFEESTQEQTQKTSKG